MRSPTRLLLLTLALSSCDLSTSPRGELAAARRRWADAGPSSYAITVSHGCFCPLEAVGPVIVTVRNGVVQSRVYERTGAPVPAQFAELFPTVDGLFDAIESAQQRRVASLDVDYDKSLGYPTKVNIDPVAQIADDETYYAVTGFRSP